jgi:phage gp29-like protein
MRRDDQIKAGLSLKKDFVVGGGWQIECENPEIKEFVTDSLSRCGEADSLDATFEDILKDILSAYDYGFSISEPVYKLRNGQYTIKSIKVRAPHSFKFHVDDKGNVEKVEQNTPTGSISLKPSTLFHHIYMPEFGNPYGNSDLKSSYSPWKAKKFIERFLAIYLERFASPTIVGRGRPGMSPGEMDRFLGVLKSIQQSTEIAVPDGVQVDFIQNIGTVQQ